MRAVPNDVRGCAIVLLGAFNPPIFQPGWFVEKGLLEADVALKATDVHIDPESAYFVTPEFGCEVARDRLRLFSVPTTERREQLGDVAADAFGLLYHTPVAGISLLNFRHIPESRRPWREFAPRLASNQDWKRVLEGEAELDRIVISTQIEGTPAGVLGLAAEPSRQTEGGIYLSITHQYTLADDAAEHAEVASELLRTRWQDAIDEGDEAIMRALSL